MEVLAAGSNVVSNLAKDRQYVLGMTGCFKVEFDFVEAFVYEGEPAENPRYHEEAIEAVIVTRQTDRRLDLQHVLRISENKGLKHWRQIWEYEPNEIWDYLGGHHWRKRALSAEESKGMWVQRVFEVHGGPRYQALGPWIRSGVCAYWEASADAPHPRRELHRKDYDVLERHNRQAVGPEGWEHRQSNQKVRLEGEKRVALANEFGLNRYTKVPEHPEIDAWWNPRAPIWDAVHAYWEARMAESNEVVMDPEQKLYPELFEAVEGWLKEKANSERIQKETAELLAKGLSFR
ncbi:MAG: DUF6607 family protein [Fimbriimonadaceae bacterium]